MDNFELFSRHIESVLNSDNIITRYIQRFAYGTDASFYRLVPKVVLRVDNENELINIFLLASKFKIPVTFRAAGTSLSGQAITDSVLIILSPQWNKINVLQEGFQISLQPGVIGAKANKVLSAYSRKIGPDPASINSCKIGGIAANNSSGMCCGVKDNSYHTLAGIELIFADGNKLNTLNKSSCESFLVAKHPFVTQLMTIVDEVKSSPLLVEQIKHKYRLKNTTGYGLNALIDYENPIDILSHLIIGSEGTLAFISNITYNTIEILPHKATGLFIFDTMDVACDLVEILSSESVDAIEIMDCRSLNSVKAQLSVLIDLPDKLDEKNTALLIEFSNKTAKELLLLKEKLLEHIYKFNTNLLAEKEFTTDVNLIDKLWKIRKGMFPAVGAVREAGTTVIIEDVALPLNLLAQGVKDLHKLFKKYNYDEAIIFGHALAGNLHFIFTQSFDDDIEIKRYDDFMADVTQMVAIDYKGSLKAEHGTGRNMAPFVELEWGSELYQIMQRLKNAFDPQNTLNPGVIINDNKKAHIQHLKTMAPADELIDKCIECGFCESVCPSQNFTLTPRQRIAVWRQIKLLKTNRNNNLSFSSEDQKQLTALDKDYQFYGIDSCAATGLCGQECPVNIDTGSFIKKLRVKNIDENIISNTVAKHFSTTSSFAKFALNSVNIVNKVIGDIALDKSFKILNRASHNIIPQWYCSWPKGAKKYQAVESVIQKPVDKTIYRDKVVYIPSCSHRIFATDNKAMDQRPLQYVIESLLRKAKIEMVIPKQSNNLCCGMPWESKGLKDSAKNKRDEFINVISVTSEQGRWPVITDASPCAYTLNNDSKIIYEITEFMVKHVLDKLLINKSDEIFMLHITCSSTKMDEGIYLKQLAFACSDNVVIPEDIHCCGFAGDKGFYLPELNKSALAPLKSQVPLGCTRGLSNSRTCEIGLSEQSGLSYQSVLYLLDQISTAKNENE